MHALRSSPPVPFNGPGNLARLWFFPAAMLAFWLAFALFTGWSLGTVGPALERIPDETVTQTARQRPVTGARAPR